VEIFKSSLWTLAYRELSIKEHAVQAARSGQAHVPTHGVTD
jgi:hypothetical protein